MKTHISNIRISNRTKQAVIEIEGEIGVPESWQFESDSQRIATYDSFSAKLEKIRALSSESVRVNIRSMGGNVNDALLMYEALQSLEKPISTHCYGYVASAATIIAQAAAEGQRHLSENSLYLIHNAVTDIQGNKIQMERTAQLLGKTDQRIAELYSRHTTMSAEQCAELMAKEDGNGSWLTPDEALELGLIDHIEKLSHVKEVGQKVKNFLRNVANPETETQITPCQAARIAAKLTEKTKPLDASEALPQSVKTKEVKAPNFKPTETTPIPDPVAIGAKLSENQKSYAKDLELFS